MQLHKIVEEIFVAILVAGHFAILRRHHVIVGVVSLPGELLALFRNSCFLLALSNLSDNYIGQWR